MIAALRATGKATTLGYDVDDGMGTNEELYFNGVVGNRWAWTTIRGSYAESADARVDQIFDLRTGKLRNVTVQDDSTEGEAVALPGALVTATNKGVEARFFGRRQVLSGAPATHLAAVGTRVYWREEGVAKTAELELPDEAPERRGPVARTIFGCKPKRGARLLEHDGRIVITRVDGVTWACRRGKTRRLTTGLGEQHRIVSGRAVAYSRPGAVGVLDLVSGARRELPTLGGPLAADRRAIFAGSTTELTAWRANQDAPEVLRAGFVSELAVGVGDATVVYWVDGSGAPHTADVS
jgi:hypothetical protein